MSKTNEGAAAPSPSRPPPLRLSFAHPNSMLILAAYASLCGAVGGFLWARWEMRSRADVVGAGPETMQRLVELEGAIKAAEREAKEARTRVEGLQQRLNQLSSLATQFSAANIVSDKPEKKDWMRDGADGIAGAVEGVKRSDQVDIDKILEQLVQAMREKKEKTVRLVRTLLDDEEVKRATQPQTQIPGKQGSAGGEHGLQ